MTRDQVEKLATRAAAEENEDRRYVLAGTIARNTERSPMRRNVSNIRMAITFGVSSNDFYLLETAFLRKINAGDIELDPGSRSADSSFIRMLASVDERKALLDVEPFPNRKDYMDIWEIAHLEQNFLSSLPTPYKALGCTPQMFEKWQEAIVEGSRTCPFDVISDIAFYALGA
jgi:hypothetical protein